MHFVDLTGKTFGKLTVLYRLPNHIQDCGKQRTMWYCKCECGEHKEVSSDYLKYSKCPSCGCEASKNRSAANRKDHVGQKFGRLTIVEALWGDGQTKARYICDCGSEYIGLKADIVFGHTQSCGCLQKDRASEINTKDWSGVVSDYGVEFIKQEKMNKKGQWLWRCKCGLCGKEFVALPAKINSGHTTSCGCAVQSASERYIDSVLRHYNISFKGQYVIPECKNIYVLRFDFAVFKNNNLLFLIEYDGKQHFTPVDWFGGQKGFEQTKKRDEIKNNYCSINNIPLLRLPYTMSNKEIKNKINEYYLSVTTAGQSWQHVC